MEEEVSRLKSLARGKRKKTQRERNCADMHDVGLGLGTRGGMGRGSASRGDMSPGIIPGLIDILMPGGLGFRESQTVKTGV